MYYVKNFKIWELVPPDVYAARGEKAIELLDDRALMTLDQLREKFGVTAVNTYKSPAMIKEFGLRQECGLRWSGTDTGAKFSQHKRGAAFDCLFRDHSAQSVREYVMAHPDEFPYINAIESGVSWFHFDCRNCERITVFPVG